MPKTKHNRHNNPRSGKSSKRSKHHARRRPSRRSSRITWTGGIFPRTEGRGFLGVWVDDRQGAVVGMDQLDAHDDAIGLVNLMRRAVATNPLGQQTPSTVRVLTHALADRLREHLDTSIRLVVKPEPEFEQVILDAVQMLDQEEENERGLSDLDLFGPDASDSLLSAYFTAAAKMARTEPWKAVPTDVSRLGVSAPSLGIEQGVVLVFGDDEQAPGLYLFRDTATIDRFLISVGAGGDIPSSRESLPMFTVVFQPRDTLTEATSTRIDTAGWTVNDKVGVPLLVTPDSEESSSGPSEDDYRLAAVLCDTLASFIDEHRDELGDAWEDDATPIRQTLSTSVQSNAAPVEVTWQAPAPFIEPQYDATQLVVLRKKTEED